MGIGMFRRAREQQGAISQEVAPSAMDAQLDTKQDKPRRRRRVPKPQAGAVRGNLDQQQP